MAEADLQAGGGLQEDPTDEGALLYEADRPVITDEDGVDCVYADDGRRIAFEVAGARDGYPIFLLHGSPGSRVGPRPRGIVLQRMGAKLISPDRAGYGMSDRNEGRSIADYAYDVERIANALELKQFAVVGRSAGAPHALGCLAVLGDRVSRVSAMVGLAPPISSFESYQGMTQGNREAYGEGIEDEEKSAKVATAYARTWTNAIKRNPESLLDMLECDLAETDRYFVKDIATRRLLVDSYAEAVKNGPGGWIDDILAARKPWGFGLQDIAGEVHIWHGMEDAFSPVSHAKELSRRLTGARVSVQLVRELGHFSAFTAFPRVLSDIVNNRLPLTGVYDPSSFRGTYRG